MLYAIYAGARFTITNTESTLSLIFYGIMFSFVMEDDQHISSFSCTKCQFILRVSLCLIGLANC